MGSIENFYWILFNNLLKPFGLDCYYYYPFGTKDNLSQNEFQTLYPLIRAGTKHHVLFHFDQEPIWNDHFGIYDTRLEAWNTKLVKVLANSEHSLKKKQICQHRHMLDWYFFYHGFAALDWFRDSRFIDHDETPVKVFSSLNHLVHEYRAYRMAITARLLSRNLASFGDISFHASRSHCQTEIDNPYSLLTNHEKRLVASNLLAHDFLPLILDTKKIDGNFSAHFGYHEYRLWQNSFVHLVNETVFYDHKLHLTEKIFKPIVSLRPFVLASAPGNLAYLRSYGFETFSQWWDESYDLIEDPSERSDMIVDIIENLCSKSQKELIKMHDEMKPLLEFNKRHFFGAFRKLIVDELVDNFFACIQIWNNGRVDERQLESMVDANEVKRLLDTT